MACGISNSPDAWLVWGSLLMGERDPSGGLVRPVTLSVGGPSIYVLDARTQSVAMTCTAHRVCHVSRGGGVWCPSIMTGTAKCVGLSEVVDVAVNT